MTCCLVELIHYLNNNLTHWGRVTHICISDLTSIGSGNGLSPGRRQAIIRTNAGILLIRPLGTNFSAFFSQNSNIFIQENVLESVVCEKAAILSRPQWVHIPEAFSLQWGIYLGGHCWDYHPGTLSFSQASTHLEIRHRKMKLWVRNLQISNSDLIFWIGHQDTSCSNGRQGKMLNTSVNKMQEKS